MEKKVDYEEWIGFAEPARWTAALAGIPHSYWHGWVPRREFEHGSTG